MVDQQKNTSPDDEYQFPQEEYVAAGDDTTTSKQSVKTETLTEDNRSERTTAALSNLSSMLQRNKRIFIIIGLALLVLLFLHFSASKKTKVAPTPVQAAPQSVVSTPVQQSENNSAMRSLDSLQTNSVTTSSDIKQLQAQISDLQNAVNQAQSANTQLLNTVGTLTEQIKEISGRLDQVIAARGSGKKEPQITYHLRAVIADRAWITSDADQTKSVAVGDEVKSYGRVTAIHQQQGIVDTSSGRKIEYGPNDR